MSDKPARKRRWFRFSMKTLLIVVVLLSLPLGWFGLKMRQAERQRKAVEAIREAGGWVMYDFQYDQSGMAIRQPESPVPTWLVELFGVDLFADVVEVVLDGSEASDVALEDLNGTTSLVALFLSGTQVTDAGLEHLEGMTSILHLDLPGTQVTDAGLEHLKVLPNLDYLNLSDTHVTEEGIEELQEAIPNCRIEWDRPTSTQP